MDCAKCKAANPDGKRFCGDCGSSLEPLDEEFRRKVQTILREQLRDQRMVEIETADAVLARIKTLAKPFLYAAGVVFGVLGVLGFRSVKDVVSALNAAQQQAVLTLKSQAGHESQQISLEAQRIREQLSKVGDQGELIRKVKDTETQITAMQAEAAAIKAQEKKVVASLRERLENDAATLAQWQSGGTAPAAGNGGGTRKIGMPGKGGGDPGDNEEHYLAVGSRGREVEKVQQRLVALGCFPGPVNGDYDQATYNAVERFNRLRGDPLALGAVDPPTYRALFDKNSRCR